MLISRGLSTLRALKKLHNNDAQLKQVIRHSHDWNYRKGPPPPSRNILLIADLIQGFAWWWVLWHCFTEPGHIFGEWEYADPSKWTDEELGIPS